MEGKAFSYLCVLLAIVAGVCAGPLNMQEAICAKECRADQNTLQYEVGKTYVYAYEADTVTTLQGSYDEHSSIHVRASAEIEVLAPCELVLSLRDVTLENSDPRDLSRKSTSDNQGAFKKALESRPLRFAFQSGRVESICAAQDEPQWTLNFKRGVLSALQNSMSHLETDEKIKETDVAGECETDYKVSNNGWNSVTITKSKNLLGCTGRTNAITSLQTSPYSAESDIQSLPLLKSAHNCEQTISKSGLLEKSECHESHVFRPFSNKGSGAATTVRQMLQFTKQHDFVQTRNAPADRTTTLTYEHSSEDATDRNVQHVTEKLQEICSSDDIRPETPRLFSELVFAMKSLDIYNLQSIHNRVTRNRMCSDNHDMAKQFFHDALPAMGTPASVSLMQKLISSGEVTGTKADMWLTSFAFIAKPTKEMLVEIKPLLTNINALLPVSGMVHTFCKNNADCQYDVDVRDIVRTLTDKLDYNCKGDRHTMLVTLKALGNIGVATGAIETIARCANEVNPTDVRLAAIEAYRRMDCSNNRAELESIFNNAEEDSEIRIAAYLAMMQCPSEDTITLVKNALEREEVNQVGSFVWTHLTNIRESSGQFKQAAKAILEDEILRKTFNMDARKFSRNYEGSFFLDSFNTGAMAEGNLVWSSKSFLPRSANLNLTVDLFGHSMNLFEFGGRVEGLESYLEAFFGPNGYFPDNAVSDVLKRQRRASSNRLTTLFDKYNAQMDEFKASAYFRVFGNELSYLDSGKKAKREEFNFLEFLIKLAQEHQMEFTKSFMFLDSELHIPTIIGMPLKLAINGTATVYLKVGGKMDVRKAGTSPSSLDINGYIKPSGAVEISGEMTMDAAFARSGMKMVSTLHSSTELNGLVQLQESKILNVKFNMPKEQMEVIDVQTKFFVLNGEEELEQDMSATPRVQKKSCSGNRLYAMLGLQLCGEASYPAKVEKEDSPHFPFTGPVNAALILHRRDTHQSYEFQAQIEARKERQNGVSGTSRIVHFAFNTPGSQIDRNLMFDFNMNTLTKELSAQLQSPWKNANAKGSVESEENVQRLNFNADVDGSELLYFSGELQKEALANGRRFLPSAEIRIPGRKPMVLRGAVTQQPGKLYDAEVSVENVFSKDVLLKGSVEQQGEGDRVRYNTDAEIQSPIFNSKVAGFVANKAGVFRSRVEVNYDFSTKKTHSIVLSGKYRDQSRKANFQHSGSLAVQSTQFPEYQFEIDADLQKNNRHFENNFEMIYGADRNDKNRRIVFKQEGNMIQAETFKMDHSMNLKIKPLDIIMSSRLDHTFGLNEIKTEGRFSYKPGKEITIDVGMKKEIGELTKINANAYLTLPNRELRVLSNLEEVAKDSFNHELSVQWQKNAQFRTLTTYTRVPVQSRHELRTEIYPHGMEAIILTGSTILDARNFMCQVQAELNKQSYGTTLSYGINIDGQEKALSANFEAFCPERRITFDSKIDGSNGQYRMKSATKWDAENDSSKQVVVSGTLSDFDAASVRINYPGRKVTMNLKKKITNKGFNAHGDFSWDADKTIAIDADATYKFGYYKKALKGSLSLATPFENAELLKVVVDHSNDKTDASSRIDVTYAPDKIVSLSAEAKRLDGWRHMENKFTISTPFSQFEEMSLDSRHQISRDELSGAVGMKFNRMMVDLDVSAKNEALEYKNVEASANLRSNIPDMTNAGIQLSHQAQPTLIKSRLNGQWEGKAITFTVDGKNTGNSALEGKVVFTSPFSGEISLSGQHNNNGRTYETSSEVAWAPNKKVTVSSTITHSGSGWRFENSGNFVMHTPFVVAERISSTWSNMLNDGHLVTKNEMEFNGEKLSYSVDSTYSQNALAATLAYSSSCTSLSDAAMTMEYNLSPSSVKGSLKLDHNGGNDLTLTADLSRQLYQKFAGDLKVSSQHFTTITTEAAIDTISVPVTTHFEVSWDQKKLSLDSEATINGLDEVKGEVRLITPFVGAERIVVNIDHTKQQELFNSKVNIEYESKKFTIETGVQYEGQLKLILNIFTPYRQIREMRYYLNHVGSATSFNGNSIVSLNRDFSMTSSWQADGMESHEYKADINGQYGLQTSHKYDGNTIDVEGELILSPTEKITVMTKTTMSPLSVSAELTTPYSAVKNVKGQLNFDGSSRRFSSVMNIAVVSAPGEFALASKLKTSGFNYIDGEITFSSPFESFEALALNVDHRNRRNGIVSQISLQYPSQQKIEFSSNIDKVKTEGSITLKTPFYDDITASAGFGQDSASVNIEYASDKTIEATATFQFEDKIAVSVGLSSPCPWLEAVSASFEHTGSLEAFSTRSSFSHNKLDSPIDLSVAFSLENADMDVRASLSTPFETVKEVTVVLTNKNTSWKKYDSSLSATFNQRTIFDGKSSMKFVHIGNFNGNLEMSSILKEARSVTVSFKHKGQVTSFSNSVEASLNGEKMSYSGNFRSADKIEGNFNVNDKSIIFSHEGSLDDIKSSIEVTYAPRQVVTTTASFRAGDSLEGRVEFSAPFCKDVVATVSHRGPFDNFSHNTKVTYGNYVEQVSMRFQLYPSVIGQLKLESSFIEHTELLFTHDGTTSAFKTTGMLTHGRQTIESTAEVDLRSGIKAAITLNTPFQYLEAINAELSHTGSFRPLRFSSTGSVGYAPSKKITVSAQGKLNPTDTEVQLTFTTPFVKAREGSFTVKSTIQTPMINFNADVDASVNSQKLMTAHADLQTDDQLSGNFRLTTPISGLESTSLSFTHKGEIENFQSTAVLSYSHGEMRGDMNFQNTPLSLSLSLRTPYDHMRETGLRINHNGNRFGFNSEASFEHNMLGSFSYNGQFKARRNINGEFTVQTPFKAYETIYTRFSHLDQGQGFNTEAEIGVGSKLIKGNVGLSLDSNTRATLSVQTPFEEVKDFMMTLNHEGDLKNFQSDVKVDMNRQNLLEVTTTCKTNNGIQGNLNIISLFGTHTLSFSHSGNMDSGIVSNAMIQYPGGRINSEVTLQAKPFVAGTFKFQSPCRYVQDVSLSLKHMPNNGFDTKVSFEHNLIGKMDGAAALSIQPKITATVSLNTPFEQVRKINVEFNHAAEGTKYESSALASFNELSYFASGDFSLKPLEGSIRINSPHSELRDLSAVFGQNGPRISAALTYNRQQIAQAEGILSPSQASLTIRTQSDYLQFLEVEAKNEGEKYLASLTFDDSKLVSGEMNLRTRPGVECTIQINSLSPYLNSLFVKVSHSGDLNTFTSNGQMSYNNAYTFEGACDFSSNPLQGAVSLKTPYNGARSLNAAFTHNGRWRKFQSHAEFSLDDAKFETDASFQARPIKFSGSIKTPFDGAHNLNAMLKHKGDMESFDTHAEASCDNGKWETDVTFQKEPLDFNAEIKTPFKGYRKLSAAISQKGNTGHAEIIVQQTKVEADGFLQLQPLNANINLRTPFDGVRNLNAAVRHEGDLSSFSSQAEAGYENGKVLIGCAFSKMPLQGSFNLQTPFNGASNINVAFNKEGSNGHVEASCDYGKIEADGSLQMEPLDASIHLQTPFDGFRHIKAIANQRGNSGHIEASYDYGQYVADGFFTRQPIQGSIQVKTPHDGARNLALAFNQKGESAHLDASYDYGKYVVDGTFTQQPLQGAIQFQTPHRGARNVHVAFNSNGQSAHVEGSYDFGKYEADGSFTMQPLQGSIQIKTPHAGARNLQAAFNQEGDSAHVEASCDYGKYEADGSFTRKPLQGSIHIQTPHNGAKNLKAAFSQKRKSAHVEASYDYGKYVADGSFSQQPLRGSLQIQTPHDGARNLQASFNQNGNSAHVEASHDYGRYEADGSFTMQPLQGSIEIKTPHSGAKLMKAGFSRDGNSVHAEASYNQQKFEADGNFQASPLRGNLEFKTPIEEFNNLYASISHDGSVENFRSIAKAGCDKYNIEAMTSFRLNPIEGEFTLKTPLRGSNNIKVAFTHRQSQGNFNSHVEASCDFAKYEADSFVTVNPPKAEITVKTPHKGFRNMNAVVTHIHDQEGLKTHAEVSADSKKIELDGSVKKSPIEARISLKTPFTQVRDVSGVVSYVGGDKTFTINAEANVNEHKAEAVGSFSASPLQAKFAMKTPFKNARNVQMSFQHQGDLSDFNTKAVASNENGKFVVLANVQRRPVDVKLTIKTPFTQYEEIGFELGHKGNLNKAFRTQASLQYQSDKTISVAARFKNMRRMVGDIDIKSPFHAPISGSLKHDADEDQINSQVELSMGKKAISGVVDFKLAGNPRGRVQLKTPFAGMKDMSVSFDHKMNDGSLDSTITLSSPRGDVSVSINGQYTDLYNMQGSATVASPLKNVAVEFRTNGNKENIHAESKITYDTTEVFGETNVETMEGLKLSGKLNTPVSGFEEMAFEFNTQGSFSQFQTAMSARNGDQIISGNMHLQSLGQTAFTADISTPFEALSKASVSLNHAGSSRRFQSSVQIEINDGKPVKLNVDFVNDRQLRINFDASCPYVEDISLVVSHEGLPSQFNSEITLKNKGEKSNLRVTFEKVTGLNLKIDITSPLLNNPLTFDFSHEGNMRSFTSHASFNDVKADATWSNVEQTMSLSAGIESSTLRRIEGDFKFNGDKTNFQTTSLLTYSENQRIESTIQFNSENGMPSNVQVSFTSPFEGIKSLSADIRNTVTRGKYSSRGSFTWATDRSITYQSVGRFSGSPSDLSITGSMTLKTPFTTLSSLELTTTHTHSPAKLSSKIDMDVNGNKYIDADIHLTQSAGNVAIRQPHPASAAYQVEGANANMNINWNTESPDSNFHIEVTNKDSSSYYQTSRAVSVRTTTAARTMAFSADLTSSDKSFSHNAAFAWDTNQDREISYQVEANDKSRRGQNIYDSTFRINTPLRSMEFLASHNDDSRTYTTTAGWKWDVARDQSRQMSITNTYQFTGNQHNDEIRISHPSLTKDLSIRNMVTINKENVMFATRSEIVYSNDERENLILSAKLQDQNSNYTLSLDAKHPMSSVDISFVGHAADSSAVMSSAANLKYMTAQRKTINYNIYGEIQKLRQAINLVMTTPEKNIKVSGQVSDSSVNFEASEDGQTIFGGSANFNKEDKTLSFEARHSTDNTININAKYNSPIDMKFEALRQENGMQIPESNLQIDLKNQRLVHTRLYVRPGMIEDIKARLAALFYRTKRSASMMVAGAADNFSQEMNDKSSMIMRSMPEMSFEFFSDADIASFHKDAKIIQRAWRKMFYNDEFYTKTIYRTAGRTAQALEQWATATANKINACLQEKLVQISQYTNAIQEWYQNGIDAIDLQYNNMKLRIGVLFGNTNALMMAKFNTFHNWAMNETHIYRVMFADSASAVVEKIVDIVAPMIDSYYGAQSHMMMWIDSQIEAAIEKTIELIEQIPYEKIDACVEGMIRRVNQYQALASAIAQQNVKIFNAIMEKMAEYDLLRPIYDANIQVADKIEKALVFLTEAIDNPVASIHDALTYIHESSNMMAARILSAIENEYMHNAAESMIEKVREIYNHHELDTKVLDAVKQVVSSGLNLIKDNAYYLVNDYLGLDKDRLMVYNPRGGELEFELYVPSDMPKFRIPIDFEDVKNLYMSSRDAIVEFQQSIPSVPDYNIWDMYYQYKPDSNPSNWIPPFEGYAAISGDQHFITFDKKFYEFAGNCDYVLASDFIDGNFTIVANYKNGKRTGITVMTNDQEFEISEVTKVNGDISELPYEDDLTTITRTGDIIRLDNTLGFTVTCDVLERFCSVNISGWYFGKTAGLFGTYSNEASDDFMTSTHQVVGSVEEFAQSWAVGSCRDQNNYASAVAQIENSECDKFFKSSDSALRPCFKVVDPTDFYKMCLSDARIQQGDECKSASLYRFICNTEGGIEMSMPAECSTCSKPVSGEMAVDEEMTINNPPKSADVVFVVEEKACNLDAASRLFSLSTKIDQELHNQGLKNTRFGLVAFGGNGIHEGAHSHTVGGKIFEDVRKMRSAFQSLKMEGTTESDTLEALAFASNYPFRTGVSKSIVLVTCGVCQEASVNYDEVAEMFEDMDITLHVLSEYEFSMESVSQSPKTNYLFGIDAKTAYTVRHVSDAELVGDEELFAKLADPETQCADLAQETGGSFFNIKKLTEGRIRFQKSFADIFSRRVAKDAVPASCQVCECQYSSAGVGKTVCTPCIENNPAKQAELDNKAPVPTQVYKKVQTTKAPKVKKVKKNRRMRKRTRAQ